MKTKTPSHLSKEAQTLWSELKHEYDINDRAGILLLTTAMEARDRLKQAAAIIKKEGLQLPDRFGQMKAHPLTTVERDSRAAMLSALKALNLDLEPLNDRPGRPAGK